MFIYVCICLYMYVYVSIEYMLCSPMLEEIKNLSVYPAELVGVVSHFSEGMRLMVTLNIRLWYNCANTYC